MASYSSQIPLYKKVMNPEQRCLIVPVVVRFLGRGIVGPNARRNKPTGESHSQFSCMCSDVRLDVFDRAGASPLLACSDRATRRLTLNLRATSVSSSKACASLATWRDRPSAWSGAMPRDSGTGSPASQPSWSNSNLMS
jgi:hypothetical protein